MTVRALRFSSALFVRLVLSVSALALLPAGCGSSDDTTTTSTQPLTCQAGQFRLQGTVDSQSVDITESSAGGGFDQVGTGELQVGQNADPSAPPVTQLHLTWAHGLLDGESSAASGTVTLATGPLAGQPLCAGNGTRVTIYKGDKGLGLVLGGLASGANCETPVQGTLAGCWN
jgi:hypothetical protein